MSLLQVNNLIFEYPGKRALKNISLSIPEQTITALVGPNGAGKTTLFRCLAGLDSPLSGNISIADIDIVEHPRKAHRNIGYLSDFFGVYKDLSVRQCLTYIAGSRMISQNQVAEAVDEVAKSLSIDDRLDMLASELSRGLTQRLAIAQAIIHKPKLLLLDEPASGLDPQALYDLGQLFLELKSQGMTILISSKNPEELFQYCDGKISLNQGKIVKRSSIYLSNQTD